LHTYSFLAAQFGSQITKIHMTRMNKSVIIFIAAGRAEKYLQQQNMPRLEPLEKICVSSMRDSVLSFTHWQGLLLTACWLAKYLWLEKVWEYRVPRLEPLEKFLISSQWSSDYSFTHWHKNNQKGATCRHGTLCIHIHFWLLSLVLKSQRFI